MDYQSEFKVFYYGCSMHPVFTLGDVLICHSIPWTDYQVGDIIYIDNGKTVPYVHRIIRIEHDGFLTHGDNCLCPDSFRVSQNCIVALVKSVSHIPSKKHIQNSVAVPVPRGKIGLLLFYKHQIQLHLRLHLGFLKKILLHFAFWRIPITETANFQGVIWYYYKGKPIAYHYQDGNKPLKFLKKRYQLFYRIPIQSC